MIFDHPISLIKYKIIYLLQTKNSSNFGMWKPIIIHLRERERGGGEREQEVMSRITLSFETLLKKFVTRFCDTGVQMNKRCR